MAKQQSITETYMQGHEVGFIYGLMFAKTPIRKTRIRVANKSAVQNLAKQFGYSLKFKPKGKKWLIVKEK